MFADAHRISTESFERRVLEVSERFDRRVLEVSEQFDRRLHEELNSFRIEITRQFATLRVDIIKWSFLFWLGQVAVILSVLSFVMRVA